MPSNMSFEEFADYLKNTAPKIQGKLEKTIAICCEKVRSDIQDSMAKTERNMNKSYYTHNKKIPHHPSLPENPPAPDSGNLRRSIRYEIHNEKNAPYGVVGSTQKEPNYAVWMEYGTSDGRIAPRPWLRPAMQKNNEWIKKTIAGAVKETFEGGGK